MFVLWESKTKRVVLVFNSDARIFEIWHGKISSVMAREIAQAEKQLQYYKNLNNDYPVKYYKLLTFKQCQELGGNIIQEDLKNG
jgi:hypothetical protein